MSLLIAYNFKPLQQHNDVSKLSELLKDIELTNNYSNNAFTILWRNGKMQQAFAQDIDWNTDKYNDKYPIDTTTKFDR